MNVRAAVRQQAPYRFSHHPQRVKLDQNESPDDLPPPLRAEVLRRLGSVAFNRYPDLHPVGLEKRLAARHGWDPDGVVAANGSNSLVLALAVISALGRSLVTVAPSFQLYRSYAGLVDASLVELPLGPRFELPVDVLCEAVGSRSGLLLLANPAAPTGNLFGAADVTRVVSAASDGMLCAIDEAYADFAGRASGLSSRTPDRLGTSLANVVTLRTFSKAFGLAGARIGYALTTPELAADIRKALPPFCVSAVQEAIVGTLLDHEDVVEERIARIVSEREKLIARLRALNVEAFDSAANFVLFKVEDPAALHASLLKADIVVRRQDHLPGAEGCLRVSVGTPAENDEFIEALTEALGEGNAAHG
ncbi:MAG: histidinol-phosphate aminotransferase family protein [Trueperaceae bacterium]|nr:histidinol-phosphate aminotransferase family protein [Trueperaceae bacterium]